MIRIFARVRACVQYVPKQLSIVIKTFPTILLDVFVQCLGNSCNGTHITHTWNYYCVCVIGYTFPNWIRPSTIPINMRISHMIRGITEHFWDIGWKCLKKPPLRSNFIRTKHFYWAKSFSLSLIHIWNQHSLIASVRVYWIELVQFDRFHSNRSSSIGNSINVAAVRRATQKTQRTVQILTGNINNMRLIYTIWMNILPLLPLVHVYRSESNGLWISLCFLTTVFTLNYGRNLYLTRAGQRNELGLLCLRIARCDVAATSDLVGQSFF